MGWDLNDDECEWLNYKGLRANESLIMEKKCLWYIRLCVDKK